MNKAKPEAASQPERPAETNRAARPEHQTSTSLALTRILTRKQLWAIGGSLLLALIGGVSGSISSYYLAPAQSTSSDQAAQRGRDAADAKIPALKVISQRVAPGQYSEASPDIYSLASVRQSFDLANTKYLPGNSNVRVGIPTEGSAYVDTQPRTYSQYIFTLVGQRNRPVIVRDMVARVVARREPVGGTLFWVGSQGSNSDESIGFDLDTAGAHKAELMQENTEAPTETGQLYFDRKYLTMAKDEPVQFLATVFTRSCSCDFVIDATLHDGEVVTIDNQGSPWKTETFASQYVRAYTLQIPQELGRENEVVECQTLMNCVKIAPG